MNSRYRFTEYDPTTIAIVYIVWAIASFSLASKMGYRGKARWYLTFSTPIPITFVLNFLVLACITLPIQKELRELRKQVKLKSSEL